MPELIYRNHAEQAVEAYLCSTCELKSEFCPVANCPHLDSTEILKSVPTIEAEPVRHASWKCWTTSRFTGKYKDYDEPEFKDYQYYQCTACYRKSAIKELYCPACGAKMDGGTENV